MPIDKEPSLVRKLPTGGTMLALLPIGDGDPGRGLLVSSGVNGSG